MTKYEMNKPTEDLIYLVSCAVNQIAPDPERCAGMDDETVFQEASRHLVAAAAAYALKRTVSLPYHWKEAMGKSARNIVLYETERAKIFEKAEECGIWYLPLKGIILKDLYPSAAMREMSDNDILVDGDRMADLRTLMTDLGFTCKEFGKSNHDKYIKAFLTFEMHRELFVPFNVPVIAAYYSTIREKMIKDEGNRCGYHLKDEDFYLYILCHIYKHYINAGTGLRSLLDIYVYLKAKGAELDRGYLDAELDKVGLRDFEAQIRTISGKLFGFLPLTEKEKEELSYYLDSGCYGVKGNKIANKLREDGINQSKMRYLRKRFFPDQNFLKSYYPTVYRHRALYPLLVAYRPVKGLVTKRKKLYREFRLLKEYQPKKSEDHKQ